MNESADQSAQRNDPTASPPKVSLSCLPFSAQRLNFQINRDALYRWGMLVMLMVVFVVGTGRQFGGLPGGTILIVLLLAGWFWMTINSASAGQMLIQATSALGHDAAEAEAILAQALRRWPMHRSIRLLLHHRLASLRHRQGRFVEAITIIRTLLEFNLAAMDRTSSGTLELLAPGDRRPSIGPVRAHLLLLLAECCLRVNDWPGTYQALLQLHQGRLGLSETLQRLVIQTRYELITGHPRHAIQHLAQKVQWAEMMPVAPCGAMHVMLAQAARDVGMFQAADWLGARARLLCTPERMQSPPPMLPPPSI